MNTVLKIPFVEGLAGASDLKSLKSMLEKAEAATGYGCGKTDHVNWPEQFPYRPECQFHIGWCNDGIGIVFDVTGKDLRATVLENNGRVWEDSCCEFFVADPEDGTYYNFELSCIGTLLAAKRKSREDSEHFTDDKLEMIRQFSSLERKTEVKENVDCSWSNGMFIPFGVIGIDPDRRPETVRANFYKCGDLTAHPHYLSWAPIDTTRPDFHRPEFFGTLEFAEALPADRPNKWVKRALSPAMLAVYLGIVAFLCFGHFDNISEASREFFGIPLDKIVHFCMFLPFPVLAYATFGHKKSGKWSSIFFIIVIYAIGCLLAGLTEIGQGMTDYRSCDIYDFRADALGMALSSFVIIIIDTIRHSRNDA